MSTLYFSVLVIYSRSRFVIFSGIDFDSVRVARVDDNWRYVGRVHEYLTSPERGVLVLLVWMIIGVM